MEQSPPLDLADTKALLAELDAFLRLFHGIARVRASLGTEIQTLLTQVRDRETILAQWDARIQAAQQQAQQEESAGKHSLARLQQAIHDLRGTYETRRAAAEHTHAEQCQALQDAYGEAAGAHAARLEALTVSEHEALAQHEDRLEGMRRAEARAQERLKDIETRLASLRQAVG
jgi:chromosome segregation ATPase